jgi:asparagine synthase (glutamine-hydrolysing)
MGITGWINHTLDLRQHRGTLCTVAAALGGAHPGTHAVQLSRHAAFASGGLDTGYAGWHCPHRPEPDLSVIIDGHLDNRGRLEQRLYRRRHPLRSDAEVILHAYREWGAGIVEFLEGAYAIAIWDNHTRQLLLIRDRLGLRTLFHTAQAQGVLFATRATALLAHPDVTATVDADGLNELITMCPVRSPGRPILRGIHELAPGHLVRVTADGIHTHRYWALHATPHEQDLDTTVTHLRAAIENAARPIPAHRPLSVLLSGGPASATAAALTAARHNTAAFTLTLAGPGRLSLRGGADAGTAALTAIRLGMNHTVATIGTDELIAARDTVRSALDFPCHSATDTTLHALLNRAREHAQTVVSGEGATAILGGYPWQHDVQTPPVEDFPWRHRTVAPLDLLNADAHTHLVPGAYRKERYDAATTNISSVDGESLNQLRLRRSMHIAITHHLPHLLTRMHRLSEAAGLTPRMPFADPHLAQFAWNIPLHLRQAIETPNGLLRHTVADLLPREMAWQRSLAFPSAHLLPPWQASQRAHLHDIITDTASPVNTLLDLRRTRLLIERPVTQQSREWHATVDYLIELNTWLETHRVALV